MSHSLSYPQQHHVPHHFPSAENQAESSKLGMWLFLSTEILLFSGLFCAYVVYRTLHPEIFHEMHQFLDWKLGALNTVVLIFSSLTMALAVRSAQLSQRWMTFFLLALTLLCAIAFLVVKGFEYEHKIHDGLLPGDFFHYNKTVIHSKAPQIFFSIYFLMTGLHGIHVLIGMITIIWIMARTALGRFSSSYYTPVEMVGLYWHLVDLIWIFLFPLLYLVG